MANSGDMPAARTALWNPGGTWEENDGRTGIHAMARQPRSRSGGRGEKPRLRQPEHTNRIR
ncbi:MAG: hypothetical protein KatS3mg132_076 [Limisphaera sp.]|nr:MAG: hypothetical protein KatS3mg132_076 [Limisphaera sp.]